MLNKNICDSLPWYTRIVPLVFDDSLSYYEQMLMLYRKVKELVEIINELPDTVLEQAKSYTDSKFEGILDSAKEYTDDEIKKINNVWKDIIKEATDTLDGKIDSVDKKLTYEVANLMILVSGIQGDLNSLNGKIDNVQEEFNTRIDALYGEITEYIDNRLSNFTRLYVWNPVTKKFVNCQIALNDLYATSRYGGIQALHYDECMFKAIEYDSMKISCFKFINDMHDFYLERVLHVVRDGFTGLVVHSKTLLMKIVDFLRYNPISAEVYDNLSILASEFEINAYDYDFYGYPILNGHEYRRYNGLKDIVNESHQNTLDVAELRRIIGQGGTGLGIVAAGSEGNYVV